ncbi:MAG: di-trans,poly-cis-decaprenylcistransferase [Bacilli bacterium]|nr:di-trans,poly-cis-decaprenylcistransferase [Bacilli bacterium]
MDKQILKIPNHVAIILDGNGRWAKDKGKKRTEGHKEGYKNLKKISKYIFSKGTKVLSVFAFSTENFKRPHEEVDYLMNLFIQGFNNDTGYFQKENVKVVFSGKKDNLRKDVVDAMDNMTETTKNNTKGVLNICLNYGGRCEIVDAVNKIIENNENNITEDIFQKYLYQDLEDIDLMIRTSGELRISNFMLWQLSYAELYFPNCYFPDFNEYEYDKALIEYTKRDRRFGSLNNE